MIDTSRDRNKKEHLLTTPQKLTFWTPSHGGLVQMMFLSKGVIFRWTRRFQGIRICESKWTNRSFAAVRAISVLSHLTIFPRVARSGGVPVGRWVCQQRNPIESYYDWPYLRMCMKCWVPSYQQLCWSSLTEVSVISLFFVGNVQFADNVPEKTLNLVDLFTGDHTILNLTCILRFMKRTLIVTPCHFSVAQMFKTCILMLWHVSSAQRVSEFIQLLQCFDIKMCSKNTLNRYSPPQKNGKLVSSMYKWNHLYYTFSTSFGISNSRSFVSMDSFKLNDPIVECATRPRIRGPTWRVALHVAAVLLLWSQPRGFTRAGNYEAHHHPSRQALRNGLKLHPWRLTAGNIIMVVWKILFPFEMGDFVGSMVIFQGVFPLGKPGISGEELRELLGVI